MSISLTDRDSEIIETLAHRVRVLSLGQLGRTWWSGFETQKQQAGTRMKLLAANGLVISYRALAHPEIPLTDAVLRWQPGEPTPDFGTPAYRLQSRWTKPFISTTCFMATKRGGRAFGGSGGRRSRGSEQTHDIHLAGVFLHYRSKAPDLISKWTSEAAILRDRDDRREKLPDAMIVNGEARRVIEFGGSYRKEKIASFHDYCVNQDLPYEIW